MNKYLKNLYIAIILLFGVFSEAQAQDAPAPLPEKEKTALIDSITGGYTDWQTISMSGKLTSPMLPATVSVKVYMEKDSLVVMSLSAPLVGEAARVEIDPQTALVINKFSNTYSTIDMASIEPVCPGGLTAIQNLLLGRVTIMGAGTLSPANGNLVDVYSNNPDVWTLLPMQDIAGAPFVYFYTVDIASLLLDQFIVMQQPQDNAFYCTYNWNGDKDVTLDFEADFQGKNMTARLKLNTPDATPKPISRFDLSSKYRQVEPSRIMK